MTFPQALVLFVAAILGGTLNSVAGGGSFMTFPTLVITGVPPITANATSTIALWPGSVASAGAYRSTFDTRGRVLVALGAASLIGGALGALVLLHTPSATFVRLVPFLLLAATLLFAFGGTIAERLRRLTRTGEEKSGSSVMGLAAMTLLQLVIATYGGFFGGGIGILMLAAFSVMGMRNIHTMNALKTLLNALINGVAVVLFIVAGAVVWPQALVMVAGAIVGGYGGASVARRLDPKLVRRFVILVGIAMSIYFFVRQ